jgi:dimethylhistidine N-methyltransferase
MGRGRITFVDRQPAQARFGEEVVAGLALPDKAVSPKWLYDALGSRLFEAICELPEYYLTRVEMALFRRHAEVMAAGCGQGRVLVELGCGAGEKVGLLLPHLRPRAYVAVDIARSALAHAVRGIAEQAPALDVYALCDDFARGLVLPQELLPGPRLYFYPGSSIGNFGRDDAVALLRPLAHPEARLLIGVDLVKDRRVLEAAYDDALGVTAAFNRNLLVRINRELGGTFALAGFRHAARFDAAASCIHMELESLASQRVEVLGQPFAFRAGERLHTEHSYKYTLESFAALAAEAGWRLVGHWTDPQGWFAECVFEAATA